MDLNIKELSTADSNDVNHNYWESPAPEKRKKKVSFNDILSNMNLVVNQHGVLQYMTPTPVNELQEAPIDPSVKHSYIYNKYFKNYADPQTTSPLRRVPKTIEEYRQMVLEDRIEAIRQKQRIDKIKSKKLLFTSPEGINRNIQATQNGLRKMSFY